MYLFFKHFGRICLQLRSIGKCVKSLGEPHCILVLGPLICTFVIFVGHVEELGLNPNISWFLSFAVLVRAPSHFLPGDGSIKVVRDNSSNKSLDISTRRHKLMINKEIKTWTAYWRSISFFNELLQKSKLNVLVPERPFYLTGQLVGRARTR